MVPAAIGIPRPSRKVTTPGAGRHLRASILRHDSFHGPVSAQVLSEGSYRPRTWCLEPVCRRQTLGGAPVRALIARVICGWSAKPHSRAICASGDTLPVMRARASWLRRSRRKCEGVMPKLRTKPRVTVSGASPFCRAHRVNPGNSGDDRSWARRSGQSEMATALAMSSQSNRLAAARRSCSPRRTIASGSESHASLATGTIWGKGRLRISVLAAPKRSRWASKRVCSTTSPGPTRTRPKQPHSS